MLDALAVADAHVELKELQEALKLQATPDKTRLERAVKRLALRGALQIWRNGRIEVEPGNARKPFSVALAGSKREA